METLFSSGAVNPLFLTKDPEMILRQLHGHLLDAKEVKADDLLDNISTDAIIPSRFGYQDADRIRLGRHLLRGILGGVIPENGIINGAFDAIVAGRSFGRGSSREHAQLALIGAGIHFVFPRSAERIFSENCLNYGLPLLLFDSEEVQLCLREGRFLSASVYRLLHPPLSQLVIDSGGLMRLTERRLKGVVEIPHFESPSRPMTAAEKIIAKHSGVKYTQPGYQHFVDVDCGYAYELQTVVVNEVLKGSDLPSRPRAAGKFTVFEDHLALWKDRSASNLRQIQRNLATKFRLREYRSDLADGVEGICHSVMAEKFALPGMVILGNDSHTCSIGSVSSLAIGKGASEMAACLYTGDILVTVPETIRFDLSGHLRAGVTTKDVMLDILSRPEFRRDLIGSNRVFEFGGEGLEHLPFDEQFVLANMAIEGQAFTGFIEPNSVNLKWLSQLRGEAFSLRDYQHLMSDPEAGFSHRINIQLEKIDPMIALPGDPQNSIPLAALGPSIKVDIVYLGSCTGGKLEDLIRAAKVLKGKRIHPGVKFYAQASSQFVRHQAEQLGIIKTLVGAGVEFLQPGCGACMNMGPGSSQAGQVTISDTNRNFYGRMGLGETYLANPEVVAASGVTGFICSPESI